MNKSLKSVVEKLKDHPNVEFFSRKKLGQFVGKESIQTEFKRKRITEIDMSFEAEDEEIKKAKNK